MTRLATVGANRADWPTLRGSAAEQTRAAALMRLVPTGRVSVLDVGARDGFFSRLLTAHFRTVVALDIIKPDFAYPRVVPLAGDITCLPFADRSFDCVFCAEVFEHVRDVERAAKEVVRVARHEIILGVPFKQDLRVGRTTCARCGCISPPWGHLHTFDEKRIAKLLEGCAIVEQSLLGSTTGWTNVVSTWLMDRAGNPWGAYNAAEPCVHCGSDLQPPQNRSLLRRGCGRLALIGNALQRPLVRSRPNWMHVVARKLT